MYIISQLGYICQTLAPKTDMKKMHLLYKGMLWYWFLNSPLCVFFLGGVVCLEWAEEGVCPTLERGDHGDWTGFTGM
jgi:hypothetical protein